jgi:hypothetical protein
MRVFLTGEAGFIGAAVSFSRKASFGLAILMGPSYTALAQTQKAQGGAGAQSIDGSVVSYIEPGAVSQAAPTIDAPSYVLLARSADSTSSVLPDSSMDAPQQAPSGATSIPHTHNFPTFRQREHAYFYDLIGPGAFIGAAVRATVDQTHPLSVAYPSDGYPAAGKHPAHGAVPEWGEGADGYAKRYASAFGMGLIGTTTRYGLGELLREDVSYHRCECTGFLPRTEHALIQSFVAHTESGRAIPSLPALVAPFVAAEAGVAGWYPARYNVSDALRTSSGLYYALPIKNLVDEFTRRR